MSSFTSPLRLELTDRETKGRAVFRLLDAFTYEIGAEGSGLIVTVPAGTETDFASVPRFFWRLVPPTGKHGKAAVLHDYLYQKQSGFTKLLADAIFLEAMTVLGVPWWRRWSMFLAVRFFGKGAYRWK